MSSTQCGWFCGGAVGPIHGQPLRREENMKEMINERLVATSWCTPLAVCLAALSSAGSITVAVVAGWQRGSAMGDRMLLAGVNAIAVMAAQLLPALGLQLSAGRKYLCMALWLICVAYTAQGHAWYQLAAQERSGEVRAQKVASELPLVSTPVRDLATILMDKANVTEQLARMSSWTCEGSCADRQRLRKRAMAQRLAALDAEAEMADQRRQSSLAQSAAVQHAKADLVGAQLASSLHVTYETATWITALTFALILEGVGCFCWAVVLKGNVTTTVHAEKPSEPLVFEESEPAVVCAANVTQPSSQNRDCPTQPLGSSARNMGDDVTKVLTAIRDLKIRPTVTDIRTLLRCSQAHARDVRPKVVEALKV